MKIYLAGFLTIGRQGVTPEPKPTDPYNDILWNMKPTYILESFYELKQRSGKRKKRFMEYTQSKHCKGFLLDSGAFTFMEGTDKTNFEKYLEDYISFIKHYDIDLFFELDIDVVEGIKKVRNFRERLEKGTNKQAIPVWHRGRGKEAFLKIVKKYPYVAIGGIVSGEIDKSEYRNFHWFIRKAHKNDAKIHALGLTDPKTTKEFDWDSVDSTSWTEGQRWGKYALFDGSTLRSKSSPDQRVSDYRKLTRHNLKQWIKFQKYMDNGSTQKPAKQTKTNSRSELC